jgi:hypothetical protein
MVPRMYGQFCSRATTQSSIVLARAPILPFVSRILFYYFSFALWLPVQGQGHRSEAQEALAFGKQPCPVYIFSLHICTT